MANVYRLNRTKALWSASVSISDSRLLITYRGAVPDTNHTEEGLFPFIAGDERVIDLSLQSLKALKAFDDGAMLSFDMNAAAEGAEPEWRNLFIGTLLGRRPMLEYLAEIQWNTAIRILVPARGITSFKQCRVILQMHDPESSLEANVPVSGMTAVDFLGMQFVPEITGPASVSAQSQSASYSIQLRDADGAAVAASASIYLEATAGNLNRYRVELDDTGAGTFELLTAGLAAGDTAKIKAGFRYFPGVYDQVVTIT